MLSKRTLERVAGVLFIVMAVAFAVSIATHVGIDFDRADIGESLREVIDDQALFVTSEAFWLVGSLLLVVAAAASYLVFRSRDSGLALFGLVGLLSGAMAFAVGEFAKFGLLFLAHDYVDAWADTGAIASTARAVGILGGTAWITGLTLLGAGVVPIGVLIVRSRAAPSWMGWWAVGCGVLLLTAWGIVSGNDVAFIFPAIGGIAALAFFLMLGIQLLWHAVPEESA